MSFADDIAEQRKSRAAEQASKDTHDESINAIFSSGKEVAASTNKLATSDDIDSIIQQLKELQLTQLIESQQKSIPKDQKPTVILTDQTDLGDRLTKLGDSISETVSKLDSSKANSAQLSALKDLKTTIDGYSKSFSNSTTISQKNAKDLLGAIKALKVAPIVNMPEPKVIVQPQNIDFGPLQDTIKEYAYKPDTDESIDLECYKAQDIDNTNPNVQYVGFLNQEGGWYIIENDVKANSMRYLFGNGGYSEAFSRAAEFTYSLLNEAINAVSA